MEFVRTLRSGKRGKPDRNANATQNGSLSNKVGSPGSPRLSNKKRRSKQSKKNPWEARIPIRNGDMVSVFSYY